MFDIGQKSTFLRKGPKNLTPPPRPIQSLF